MNKIIFLLILFSSMQLLGQTPYDSVCKKIKDTGLTKGAAYSWLYELCTKIGPRLSGSENAAKAITWGKQKMELIGLDNIHLESVMVPHWIRGNVEEARIIQSAAVGYKELKICALGNSVGTQKEGITSEIIEVKNFDELKAIGQKAKGKIIFFNRPMDRTEVNPNDAYSKAVNQRMLGAIEAAKVGAVASVVRSMTSSIDDIPHTGLVLYADTIPSLPKIPAAAISTKDADFLSELLKKENKVTITLKLDCQMLPDVESFNVVGELSGNEKSNEVIVVSGHLDSWDKGQGANDDGAGVVQSLEALRLLKLMGITPKRTIRVVLFMNEENGVRGGKAYAEKVRDKEKPIVAIESDWGGASPKGFGVDIDTMLFDSVSQNKVFEKIEQWKSVLSIIAADHIVKAFGGTDIAPLVKKGVIGLGLRPDAQRYYDYHHSDQDTIDKINERELELGAIAMAIMAYVLADNGV